MISFWWRRGGRNGMFEGREGKVGRDRGWVKGKCGWGLVGWGGVRWDWFGGREGKRDVGMGGSHAIFPNGVLTKVWIKDFQLFIFQGKVFMNDPKNCLFVVVFLGCSPQWWKWRVDWREGVTASNWICWFAFSSFSRRTRFSCSKASLLLSTTSVSDIML